MKLLRALVTAFLAFVSCGAGTTRESVPFPMERVVQEDETNPVIVVTVDGVRWQDVVGPNGPLNVPNLYRAGGAILGAPGHGEPFTASGPNFVSLPGYTELFEGRTHTGCFDNFCNGATVPTLIDEIRAQHTDPTSVAVIASWERIAFAATLRPESLVVSAGSVRAEGHEHDLLDGETRRAYQAGLGVPAWPGHADYRPDKFTAPIALAYLREKHPAFLFVGLGDTDEYAHRDNHLGYSRALHEADAFVGRLLHELDQMGERGRRTLLLVTADHGRASNFTDHGGGHPESARTWLFAIGGAARGFVSSPIARHLADIAPTIRSVVDLPVNPLSDGVSLTELLPLGVAQRQAP